MRALRLCEKIIDAGVVRIALINILENALDACLEDDAEMSHKIIEQHGGTLSVDSKPGVESLFKIVLPTRFPASI